MPDVSSYLIAASVENGTLEEDLPYLEGDALVLLIVGRYDIRHLRSMIEASHLVYGR